MGRIAKRDRASVEKVYEGIYKELYGSAPPKDSNARKMIRDGHDNYFAWKAEKRRK